MGTALSTNTSLSKQPQGTMLHTFPGRPRAPLSLPFLVATALGIIAGCQYIGQPKSPQVSAPVAIVKAPEPVVVQPEPPKRPSTEEVDAQIKLYIKLGRFQEASKLYGENKDQLVPRAAEYQVLLKRIIDGVNAQYDRPFAEALASMKPYEKRALPPASFAAANKAMAQAQDVMREYEVAMSIAESQQYSRNSRQTKQMLLRVAKQINSAQALLNAPENKLALLMKENKLDEANKYYRENQAYFAANVKKMARVLGDFARVSDRQVNPLLANAEKVLRPFAQADMDSRHWRAAAQASEVANGAIRSASSTAPYEIAELRGPSFRTLEQLLIKANHAWTSRAPEAFLKYDHANGPDFFKVYPMAVQPAQVAGQISVKRLAGKSAAEIKAMSVALGEAAPPSIRDALSQALALAEKVQTPLVGKVASTAEPRDKSKAGAPPPTNIAEARVPPPPPKEPPVVFIDSDT